MGRLQTAVGQQGFPVIPGPLLCPHVSPKNAATILIKDSLFGSLGRREGESGRGGSGQERVTPPLRLALPPLWLWAGSTYAPWTPTSSPEP